MRLERGRMEFTDPTVAPPPAVWPLQPVRLTADEIRGAIDLAVAAEREACAAVAESMPPCCMLHDAHEDIAAAIRARGAA